MKYVEICFLKCFKSEDKPSIYGRKLWLKKEKIHGPLNNINDLIIGLIDYELQNMTTLISKKETL